MQRVVLALLVASAVAAPVAAQQTPPPDDLGTRAHLDEVMQSAFCAGCHPAIYAEHQQNTHGRAFMDTEARLATREFRRDDCVRCHTPRPIFETGIGMTPTVRTTNLADGNGCMACHWRKGYDYARFTGGEECKTAFDPRVGTVQACASCHRIAGTPGQWSNAERGKQAGKVCLDCHMPAVERPVAVGGPVRRVRTHVFPASRSEHQLRRAYGYQAEIRGNEVVVTISNRGAGHNFPTAARQRSVESLVVVRDVDGKEVARSRMTFRYPYASDLQPHQLVMPASSQIPSGQSREHHVPLGVPAGTVTCELFFKLYHPIEDEHPELSRRLEVRCLPFEGVQPSNAPVEADISIATPAHATSPEDALSSEGLINFSYPEGGAVTLPEGDSPAAIEDLVAMLSYPLPEARARARARLREIGAAAVPALVTALGSWSNETFNEAKDLLCALGDVAVPALYDALQSDSLYVRCHAREVLQRLDFPGDRDALRQSLVQALSSPEALDRRSAADVLGALGDRSAAAALRADLDDRDADVVSAAALALAALDDRDSVPAIATALEHADYSESRRDLAYALGLLGSPIGIPVLLQGLQADDPVVRQGFFDRFFAVTGMHEGYDPRGSAVERLQALARLQDRWAQDGGADALHRPPRVPAEAQEHAWALVTALGGGTDTAPGGDDEAILPELIAMGADAVPALLEGLTFPPGFVQKRSLVCEALGRIGDTRAAPYLVTALNDPYLRTATWACWALGSMQDRATLAAVEQFEARVRGAGAAGEIPPELGSTDAVVAQAARTRFAIGDRRARDELVNLLLSDHQDAREIAIAALAGPDGDRRGYDPAAPAADRLQAVMRWQQ